MSQPRYGAVAPRYAWVVVAAAFTLMFLGFAAAYSFAAFFGAFAAEFGAARGHIALVFSVAAFLWFLLGAPGGMLADRFGARRVALVGVACLAGALWLASRAQSIGMLYASYSIGVGLGVGLVYVPSVGAVQPWFGANRAFASGLAVAGIGAGNIAGPLLAAWWISLFGWRGAYVALAVFALVLGGIAAASLREAPLVRRTGALSGVSLKEALKTRHFWLLYASGVASCIGLFVPMVHLGPYAQDLGYSAAQGVTLVSLIGLGSLLGRFTIGGLADRLGRMPSLVAMYSGLGVMLVVWWLASAWWLLALFALAFGAFYGGYVALMPTIVMDFYGARAVSGIIGCLYTGAGVGTLIGPWLAGVAYDLLGAYDLPILCGAFFSFVAAACIWVLIGKAEVVHSGQ
ncbi:MAG TPA: MFS transporter [Burkholderiales bacterium]|nr:MFS transporter [Burkholderiales bacterium]